MIKAVIFDFGGVLSNFGVLGDSTKRFARVLGCRPEEVGPALGLLIGRWMSNDISSEDFWEQSAEAVGAPKANYAAKWIESEPQALEASYYDLARDLRREGYITGILSNINPMSADIVREAGAYADFSPIVLSHDVGFIKPSKEMYQALLDALKLDGTEVLLVDDLEVNQEAAQKYGIETIHAREPKATIKLILDKLSVK